MDVKALKDQARALEQQGRAPDALALYRQALDQLTSTAEALRELPLFVKVGDLSAKLGDGKTAITYYERAGEHYAAHGSAQSVVALCLKVLRVDAKRTVVYFTLARRMVDAGHVEPARAVLVDFAQRTKQQRVLEALEKAAGRPDDEVRAILEHVIDAVERSLRAREQAVAEAAPPPAAPSKPPPPPPERQPAAPPPRPAAPAPPPPPPAPPPPRPRVEPPPEPEPEMEEPEEVEPALPVGRQEPEESEPEPEEEVEEAIEVAAEPAAAAAPAASPALRSRPAPSGESVVLAAEPREGSRRRSPMIWVGLVVVVAAAGGVGYFVLQGRGVGSGGGLMPGVVVQPADSVADTLGMMLGDTIPAPADSVVAPAESAAVTVVTGRDTPPPLAPARAGDTVVTPAPAAAAPEPAPAPALPPVITFAGPVVQIEGLAVESVTEIAPGMNAGYRVVQLLGSGERLTLTVVPRGAGTDTLPSGQPNVGELAAGGAMGVVGFGDFVVSARGPVAPEVLDGLLRRLTQVGPP